MKKTKFVVQMDYRLNRIGLPKLRGNFVFHRMSFRKKLDIIESIFRFVHARAQHHNEAMAKRWKPVEKRMLTRFKGRI